MKNGLRPDGGLLSFYVISSCDSADIGELLRRDGGGIVAISG
ncbi:MAG: hypothetical protein PUF36_01910 [Prevotella sp.]|nr:hypothetical protein [Prevotella sp.]